MASLSLPNPAGVRGRVGRRDEFDDALVQAASRVGREVAGGVDGELDGVEVVEIDAIEQPGADRVDVVSQRPAQQERVRAEAPALEMV